MIRGSNLSGGDCVWSSYPVATGPVSGTHYLFVSTADVDRLLVEGMTCFRLLFSWECVQPKPWQNPATNAAGNYATYWSKFKSLVDYITSKGATCVIDIHGGSDTTFGAYRGVRIGSTIATGEKVVDLFENLYWNLGQIFRDNPLVQWGLTNEPIGMAVTVWFAAAQKAINALRTVGAKQRVWCPGIAYTGASSWVSSGNAAAWNLTDSANNLGMQVHMYLDAGGGGGGSDIVNSDIGVTRLKPAVDWARSKGIALLLAEVGFSAANGLASTTCTKLFSYIEANADVIGGWCWWSTGPSSWWGSYTFTLCDTAIGRANLTMIRPWLKPAAVVVPPPVVAPPPVVVPPDSTLQAQIDILKASLAIEQKANDELELALIAAVAKASQVPALLATIAQLTSDLTAETALSDANAARAARSSSALENIQAWVTEGLKP